MKTLVLTFALAIVTAAANAAPERMTGQQLQDAFET
jgi:hypothetical protein